MPQKLFDRRPNLLSISCTLSPSLSLALSLSLSLPTSLSCSLYFHLFLPALISLFSPPLLADFCLFLSFPLSPRVSLFSSLSSLCSVLFTAFAIYIVYFCAFSCLGSCCQLPFAIWRCILLNARLIAVTTTKLQTHTQPMPKCVKSKATDSLELVTLFPPLSSSLSLPLLPPPFPLTGVRHMQRNSSTTICC